MELFINHQGCFDLIPYEIIVSTLSFIDVDTLLNCRLVCKKWQFLIDKNVFQEKAARENKFVNNGRGYYSFSQISSNDVRKLDLEWYIFGVICKYDPFNRNLVKNHCGQYGWIHWHSHQNGDLTDFVPMTSSDNFNLWTIEQLPQSECLLGDPDFDGNTSCFTTNILGEHSIIQPISFKDYGLNKTVMRTLKPQMSISVWHNNKYHIFSSYILLLNICSRSETNGEYENISSFEAGMGRTWQKMEQCYEINGDEYYLTLNHLVGFKTQYGRGFYFYNFKLSCSVIKIILPIKFKSAHPYMLI